MAAGNVDLVFGASIANPKLVLISLYLIFYIIFLVMFTGFLLISRSSHFFVSSGYLLKSISVFLGILSCGFPPSPLFGIKVFTMQYLSFTGCFIIIICSMLSLLSAWVVTGDIWFLFVTGSKTLTASNRSVSFSLIVLFMSTVIMLLCFWFWGGSSLVFYMFSVT